MSFSITSSTFIVDRLERFIDILGAVRSIGTIRNVNTRTGQDAQVREVLLFDHTSPGLKLTIWDTDVITR